MTIRQALSGLADLGLIRRQAVSSEPDLARKLDINTRDPLLLLQGVTRDALGHGLERFNVWHSPNTVFASTHKLQPSPDAYLKNTSDGCGT